MDQNHANVLVSMWLLEASCPLLSTLCHPPGHFPPPGLARESRQGKEVQGTDMGSDSVAAHR